MNAPKAVIFDLDGVLTKTATVHTAAWKATFDDFLRKFYRDRKEAFKEFTPQDYLDYVDGKPREEGIKSFLQSRQVDLPLGRKGDAADIETVEGLGSRKNEKFREILDKDGVEIFSSTVDLIKDLQRKKIHIGIASSSKNCQPILRKTSLEKYFETRVDGVVSEQLGLKGKPEGDIFVKAAENVGACPAEAIVVEDAISGVQAGRQGEFGLVIGVARQNNEQALKENGADVVVTDFKGITAEDVIEWFRQKNDS